MFGQTALYDSLPTSPIDTTMYQPPLEITDDFGNFYSIEDVKRKATSIECTGIGQNFDYIVDYADYGTGYGFDFYAPNGVQAQAVVCQVLEDLSYFFEASPDCNGNKPVIRIEVKPSLDSWTPLGYVAGVASPYYYNYADPGLNLPSYRHSSIWRVINGGEDPTSYPLVVGNDAYHAYIQLNFNSNINWNFDYTIAHTNSFGNPDFYQVVLHELMHAFGVSSNISAAPNFGTPEMYNRFDRYLVNNNMSDSPLLNNIDNCHSIAYNNDVNAVQGGCNSVFFKHTPSGLDIPIYTPSAWAGGSSMSHFGNNDISCGLDAPFLMYPRITAATAIRRPTDNEVLALCAMGYESTGTYGDGVSSLPFHGSIQACGDIAAGVDDEGANCHDGYNFSACDFDDGGSVTIPVADLTANDINIDPNIDLNCIEAVVGNINFPSITATTITIDNASVGLNVFRYLPAHAVTGENANPTFVYFTVAPCIDDCATIEPCNVVCNPDMLNTDCDFPEPFPAVAGDLMNANLNDCITFDGWTPCVGTPNYFPAATTIGSGNIIGLQSHWNEPNSESRSETVVVPVDIEAGRDYILSFYRSVNDSPNPNTFGDLSFMQMHLFNEIDVPTVCSSVTNINFPVLGGVSNQQIYLEGSTNPAFDIPVDTFALVNVCFTADNDYDRLLIFGTQEQTAADVWSYLLLTDVNIIPDFFSEGDTIDIACCDSTTMVADSCNILPNTVYSWEQYNPVNEDWTLIPDATDPFYGVDSICMDTCYQYRAIRLIEDSLTIAFNECLNDTAYFEVCADCTPEPIDSTGCPCLATWQYDLTPASPLIDFTRIDPLTGGTRPAYVVQNSGTWTATTNELLTNYGIPTAFPVDMGVDLIIPAGIDLEITDMDFRFHPSCRILVERGAKLNLNKVNMTGLCNKVWQGIQVEGPGSNIATQFDSATGMPINFAYLEMGQCEIEDALQGINNANLPLMDITAIAADLQSMVEDFPEDTESLSNTVSNELLMLYTNNAVISGRSGGIISVERNDFINCYEGIVLNRFNKNKYYWTNCSYTNEPCCLQHIGSNSIYSNDLSNPDGSLAYPFTTIPAVNITETGIRMLDYFPTTNAAGNGLEIVSNRIYETNYGIRANRIRDILINNNDIYNNTVGISILNTKRDNAFNLQNITINGNDINNCPISIQLGGTDVTVRANDINTSLAPGSSIGEIGIFAKGGQNDIFNNNIYFNRNGVVLLSNDVLPTNVNNNVFDNVVYGVNCFGNNWGAQIICNDFNQSFQSIIAQDYLDVDLTGYPSQLGDMDDQGECDFDPLPADNAFNLPLTPVDILAFIPNNFNYYHRPGTPFTPNSLGTVTNVLCTGAPPREDRCSSIGLLRSDGDISSMTEEPLRNYEMLKKVRYYVDSVDNKTAAKNLLETIDNYVAQRQLINYHLDEGNITAANSIISGLPTAREEELRFKQLHQWFSDLEASSRSLYQLTAAEELQLRDIANSSTHTAFDAQSILNLLYGEQISIELPPVGDTAEEAAAIDAIMINFKQQQSIVENTENCTLSPMPNNGWLNIDCESTASSIAIYTLSGKLIQQFDVQNGGISTRNLANGYYIYQLLDANNASLQSGKLVIIK